MKTSIATVSVFRTLREKLEAIAMAGCDGVEIFEQDVIADDRSPREVGAMIRDHGRAVTLFQPCLDVEGLPVALRAKAIDRARREFDRMGELGTDMMLVCSNCHPEAPGGIDRAADAVAEPGEVAAGHGVRTGHEALAWGRHVNAIMMRGKSCAGRITRTSA